MKKTFILFSTVFAFAILTSCGSSSSDNKKSNTQGANLYIGSYEAEDDCSTGSQQFTSDSEAGIANVFCEGLKDEARNKGCAAPQRAQIFKTVQCEGVFPTKSNALTTTVLTNQYAFSVNECGTGIHIFSASSQTSLKSMLCKGLKDEALNNNCAKSKRSEKYAEEECEKFLGTDFATMTKPESKQVAVAPSGTFVCGAESNLCDSASQYCLISKASRTDFLLTKDCVSYPEICEDSECLEKDAKGHFPTSNNCDGEISVSHDNSKITVTCKSSTL